MFALFMQLIGVLPGNGEHPALPARHAVRRVARLPAHAGGLDADRPRALGLGALHRRAALAAYLVFLRRDVAGE